MRPVAKKSITQYDPDSYDVLRTYLYDNLGPYCSYCEAPLTNDSDVEHKAPKSAKTGFPDYKNQWRNLLLACKSCNVTKSDSPDKRNAVSSNSEEEYYMNTLATWVWPDSTSAGYQQPAAPPIDPIYRLLSYVYQSKSQNQLVNEGVLRAEKVASNASWATTPNTMVWLMPNQTYIGKNNTLKTRVLNTIKGLSLNYYNSDNPTFNDRRVLNRTAAYQTARNALADLQTILTACGNEIVNPKVTLMIKAIRETIIAMGFWSVWFSVFRGALDAPNNNAYWAHLSKLDRFNLLSYLLLYYMPKERNDNQTVLIFAGTDTGRLYLNAFK